MKTFPNQKTAMAVLSKTSATDLTVLTFGGCAIAPRKSHRVQILPDGYFISTDGRDIKVKGGQWLMDAQAFASLSANINRRKNDLMFDYEHQTLHTEQNGKPAPAAGWFKKLDYVPGEGLFAVDVNWTPTASKHISDKEYCYTSAVFSYDPETGRPVELMHVALTNHPALDGMKAIAALTTKKPTKNHLTGKPANSTLTGEILMNEALILILDLLGVDYTDDDLSNAVALAAIKDNAIAAIDTLKSKADDTADVAELTQALTRAQTSLKAKVAIDDGLVDLAKFVPVDTYNAAITQIAVLKTAGDSHSIEQLLKDNSDKVFGSERGYLTDFGKQQGFAALKALVDSRPAIAALNSRQTQGKEKPNGASTGIVALTAEQKYTAEQLGLSHKDLLTSLNSNRNNTNNINKENI